MTKRKLHILKIKIEILQEKNKEYINLLFLNSGIKNIKTKRNEKYSEIRDLIEDIYLMSIKKWNNNLTNNK